MHWTTADFNVWAGVTTVYLDNFQKSSEYDFVGSCMSPPSAMEIRSIYKLISLLMVILW